MRTTPMVPRSPAWAENPESPGPRWKKGQFLGRGTFGHVYVGFNNDSGEMCAMTEVTLFPDDAKSIESAGQPGQVIKNSNGCNLAVDIWSLGCTVLEMTTSKPPWSQYEGAAAMFKIGTSKELPAIPDHLSGDGKDFIIQHLQRSPSCRPTAAQMLEHPFVRNVAPLERPISSPEPLEAMSAFINAAGSLRHAFRAIMNKTVAGGEERTCSH